jgi:alkanesulfonate monooxygenase SsuD/methylene tetrahydromethanopterin reductase-like flavin-dependent oxidoreductase (luciferase family)
MGHHGTAYSERRALFRERILMMKALWTMDEASFEGRHHRLEPSWAWPKPVQRPHPPIILGAAAGPRSVADMTELCDGWMPLATRHDIAGSIARVRRSVADGGRDPAEFEITASGAKPESLDGLREAGVDRVIFNLPPLGADVVIPRLDMLAETAGLSPPG